MQQIRVPYVRHVFPALVLLVLLTLLCTITTGCSPVEAPSLDPEVPDNHDVSEYHDVPENHDTLEEQDSSTPHICTSNTECSHANQFCDQADKTCKNYPQLALAGHHSRAILSNGVVKCWGSNERGQMGIGTTSTQPQLKPDLTLLQEKPAKFISAGFDNTCVVLTSDEIYC